MTKHPPPPDEELPGQTTQAQPTDWHTPDPDEKAPCTAVQPEEITDPKREEARPRMAHQDYQQDSEARP